MRKIGGRPMASEQVVLFQVDDGIAIVTLNRPDRLNAVTPEVAYRLVELLSEIRERDDVRAVVLTGAGRHFCAGGDASWIDSVMDLSQRPPSPRHEMKLPGYPFANFTRAIIGVDKPVIAAISGVVMGIGLAFALATDRRIADTTARMAAIFVKRGLIPEGGISFLLPKIVGLPRALKMVTTGEMLDAKAAKEAGLIDDLVEEGQALTAALEYAKQFSRGPGVAVDLARRHIYKGLLSTLDEVIEFEAFGAALNARTNDAQEGIKSFLERREPVFKGD
jgi:2-(1,2-epoxy-1,2-dihydrophenyl)acetyl-CoA isomerase